MTSLGAMTALALVLAGWGALVLTRLHDARAERALEAAEANFWHAKADAEYHRAEALGKNLIASYVTASTAESLAAEMTRQRDDARRRLAAATFRRIEG